MQIHLLYSVFFFSFDIVCHFLSTIRLPASFCLGSICFVAIWSIASPVLCNIFALYCNNQLIIGFGLVISQYICSFVLIWLVLLIEWFYICTCMICCFQFMDSKHLACFSSFRICISWNFFSCPQHLCIYIWPRHVAHTCGCYCVVILVL